MGREARARVTWQGQESTGKALLETDEVVFRGDFRLRIPFAEVRSATAEHGTLLLKWKDQTAAFALGDEAAVWAPRILQPKPLIDKMNIKPGAKVVLLGVRDEAFLDTLVARTEDITTRAGKGADVVVYLAETKQRLAKLPDLAKAIKPDGAVWVVHPKGRQDLKDIDVIAAGKAAGLVDNKVVKFSDTHSALRFVLPLSKRPGKESGQGG